MYDFELAEIFERSSVAVDPCRESTVFFKLEQSYGTDDMGTLGSPLTNKKIFD
jgi:hypothetical protein